MRSTEARAGYSRSMIFASKRRREASLPATAGSFHPGHAQNERRAEERFWKRHSARASGGHAAIDHARAAIRA